LEFEARRSVNVLTPVSDPSTAEHATTALAVSVIICTYTQRRWEALLAAVASVGRQTHAVVETIVVKDHDSELLERAGATLRDVRVMASAGERGLSGAPVIAAGFPSAVAVKNALSHHGDDPWAIARWTVRSTIGAQQIARILDGRGAPCAWRHERLRTRGYRAVPRVRRTLGRGVGSRR
jgi:hypothetical protein